MKAETLRLFQTLPHPCGYFEERIAQNLVLDPTSPQLPHSYGIALTHGYRRAGTHVYHPCCQSCHACVAARIPISEFKPNRSQQRCSKHNTDLIQRLIPAKRDKEHFALYGKYLNFRHRGGGMDNPSSEDFDRFLYTSWSPTFFLEFRLRNKLVAAAVTDITRHGLSAVYTYFDPDEIRRSLGTYAILSQINLAREKGIPHLYLGYWIAGHPKMHYKADFQPLEILEKGQWRKASEMRS